MRRQSKIQFQRVLLVLCRMALFLFLLASAVFFLIRLMPGGPFDLERPLTEEARQALNIRFGLNAPVWHQYILFLARAIHFDFGNSLLGSGEHLVLEVLTPAMVVSMTLGLGALLWSLLLGTIAAAVAHYWAAKRDHCIFGKWVAGGLSATAWFGVCTPTFLVSIILVWTFSIRWNLLPAGLWQNWRSAVLPIVVLGLRPFGLVFQLISSKLEEIAPADFVKTARSKGLLETRVVFVHALSNALGPVTGALAGYGVALLGGSFGVEWLFGLPGLGRLFVGAILGRDYPTIVGVTLLYGVLAMLLNGVSMVLHQWADPRVGGAER